LQSPISLGYGLEGKMQEIEAKIGCWYRTATGEIFEVVATEGADAIEVQHFGGEVEELDRDSWRQMLLVEIEAPDDWTGAYEDLERDDLGYSDAVRRPANWSDPLAILDEE
jgi:hypothetical protein